MISVVTPSIRPEMLEIVGKCLKRQTHQDFEWLVVSPENFGFGTFIQDPPKREGDYYSLNKAWNAAFKVAKGDLIVSIVDGLWFPPDTLEKLWAHYEANPKACVTCVGHQYDQIENGKPEHMVWREPRVRTDFGSFYEVLPIDFELCIASLPLKAIQDVGGIDEEYDKGCAVSEKELCCRIEQLGYRFFIDQTIEYRAIKHDRIGGSEAWDKGYEFSCRMFDTHLKEIQSGKRLKLDYLS